MPTFIKENIAWLALTLLSLLLIIGGLEGAMGRVLACLLVPSQVVINTAS